MQSFSHTATDCRLAMAAAHKPDPSTSHDGPSKLSRAVTTGTSADEADLASHVPSKMLTPHAEHLRFGHVDYEAIEQDADEEKRHYLIRRPRAHQWFFKGKLYRSPEGRSSSRMELFFVRRSPPYFDRLPLSLHTRRTSSTLPSSLRSPKLPSSSPTAVDS